MKKTDFTTKKKNAVDVTEAMATSNTRDIKGAEGVKEEVRFSARFTPDQWKYLQEKKWTSRKSITAILQEYVEADMKKHPEILKSMDELNG